jgi:hypothetical protein
MFPCLRPTSAPVSVAERAQTHQRVQETQGGLPEYAGFRHAMLVPLTFVAMIELTILEKDSSLHS